MSAKKSHNNGIVRERSAGAATAPHMPVLDGQINQ
jgi:hypothetical protein